MLEIFFPDLYVKSILELPVEKLKKRGIRALIFDIDNTIVPFDQAEAGKEMVDFLAGLKEKGFQLCLLSNNNHARVDLFNQKIQALAVARAGKPKIKKLRQAMKKMGTDEKSTALIGDQAFTDMLCGNRAGLLTILTAPVCNRDQFVTKIKRGAERIVLQIYFKRSGQVGHYQ